MQILTKKYFQFATVTKLHLKQNSTKFRALVPHYCTLYHPHILQTPRSKGRVGEANYPIIRKNYIWQNENSLNQTSFHFESIRRYYSTKKLKPKLKIMKLEEKQFQELFTPEMRKLQELFEKYGYELRIAGGAVRDLLTGAMPHDLDFATTATPTEMKELFTKEGVRMLNMNGEKHGTITCRIDNKENFEVTTLRIDVVTDGRHAEVKFTKDWIEDAERRDLTINSMFLGFDGTIHDYFNGSEDLQNKKVRFVGEPVKRIQEDYLRILRYFRFYGRIAADEKGHEKETLQAIRENMHGLGNISGERIWVEVKKIVTGNHSASLVEVMMDLGMAKYIGLPEKTNIKEFHKVYERCHTLSPKPMTLLPALLESEDQVYTLHDRIKMSRDELRNGLLIIQHRNDDFGPDPLRYCKDLQCDTVGRDPKTKDRICELLKYLGKGETLEQYSQWTLPKFPVSGISLLQRGVPKGPALAKTMSALREIWKDSGFEYNEEDLLAHLEKLDTVLNKDK